MVVGSVSQVATLWESDVSAPKWRVFSTVDVFDTLRQSVFSTWHGANQTTLRYTLQGPLFSGVRVSHTAYLANGHVGEALLIEC